VAQHFNKQCHGQDRTETLNKGRRETKTSDWLYKAKLLPCEQCLGFACTYRLPRPQMLKYVFRIHETRVMPINMAAEYTMRLDIIGSL